MSDSERGRQARGSKVLREPQKRALGRTGLEVSAVGFGAWGLGTELWRGVEAGDAEAALVAALDAGCNFIDTALIYGSGASERRIGAVLRTWREPVVVASKIPPLDGRWPPDPDAPLEQVFPAEHVAGSVDRSLANLGRDALEVEQLHVWLDRWLDDPYWPVLVRAMEDLVRAGKVRHWGISVNDHAPDTALRALEQPILETVQVIYNIFDRSPERELLPRAAARRVGVIARVRELALRFCLSRREVSTVIPGARRPVHARANLAVADGRRLSHALLARLAEHAWDKNWYDW